MPIRKLKARQILDARGEPTIEVDLVTEIGLLRSSVPSAVFTCDNEAKEVRDGDETAYHGRSVLKVVEAINNEIAPELLKSKLDVNQQREIDLLLQNIDGTPDKSRLGVNAILGISMACCKASAAKRGLPLYRYIAKLCENEKLYIPVPAFNVVSGGRAASNDLIYQEFLIMPIGAESFAEAMRIGAEVYHELEHKLAAIQEVKLPLGVLDSGAFAPKLDSDTECLVIISEAIKDTGYEDKVSLGINARATAFCKEGVYDLEFKAVAEDESDVTEENLEACLEPEALREQYTELMSQLPELVIIEDPFDQEDWDSWSALVQQAPELQVIAGELVATNPVRLEEAIEKQASNCLLVRLGQIGTVTEAIDCIKRARTAGWGISVGAGRGETEDTFVADFAVGVSASHFKAGAPCHSEGIAKYNQILRIEEELRGQQQADYVGAKFRNPFADTERSGI